MATPMILPTPLPQAPWPKGWREAMGYSIREAAKALGCSRAAWTGWEQGRHPAPRYIALAASALASGLGPCGTMPAKDKPPC